MACDEVANAVYDLAAQVHKVGVIIKEQQFSMRDTVIGGLGRQDKVCPAFRNIFFGTGCRVWRVELGMVVFIKPGQQARIIVLIFPGIDFFPFIIDLRPEFVEEFIQIRICLAASAA